MEKNTNAQPLEAQPLKAENILVYSLFSYGLYGALGLRDFVVYGINRAFLRLILFLAFAGSFFALATSAFDMKVVQDFVQPQKNFVIYLTTTLVLFVVLFFWEVFDLLKLLKNDNPKLSNWASGEQLKFLLLFFSWTAFIGLPWFLAKKNKIASLKIVLLLAGFASFFLGNTLGLLIFISLGVLFDFILGITPLVQGKFDVQGFRLQDFIKEKTLLTPENGQKISPKNKYITLLLLFSFGKWGVHDFYTKRISNGLIKVMIMIFLFLSYKIQYLMGSFNNEYRYYFIVGFCLRIIMQGLLFWDSATLFLAEYKDGNQRTVVFYKDGEK